MTKTILRSIALSAVLAPVLLAAGTADPEQNDVKEVIRPSRNSIMGLCRPNAS